MRRFYNRNPTVSRVFSDNAASFRRAAKEIKWLFDLARSEETQEFLSSRRITWQFNTERAPWRGGFYERLFRTIKEPLRKILGKNILNFRELETTLTDVEKMVNDRPLTLVSNDSNEMLPLRPADLLYGIQGKPALPETEEIIQSAEQATAEVLSDRWKHQQNVLNAFWKRFRTEYIQHVRSAHMSKPVKERSIKVGDVVLLEDPAASRSYWPMGRVLEFVGREGPDGKRRTCMVRLQAGKILRRPIQLLYPLDVAQY
ncbi:uncharacterized protein LOC114828152 [Galendromus occidentalis]|uniref:Uncharacterized protein LOC114828152 n=1 Tax=Galendromus occidentalis TaxID=34638 RepID=A0AAJ7SE06_9ACAR|nr:uncharacterized protein LOC114828152 [Galendromus occidentalis]